MGVSLLTGCGSSDSSKSSSSSSTDSESAADEDVITYTIGVIISEESDENTQLLNGFTDAANDTFGEGVITLDTHVMSAEENADTILTAFLLEDVDMIYTIGSPALSATSVSVLDIPIVGTGVYDFQDALHMINTGSSWDRYTDRNVTGITATPSVPLQLSEMIEITPDMEAVGILYTADDNDAVYQNELLEKYLDQAGIPWREYELDASDAAETTHETEADYSSVVSASLPITVSGREGANTDITSIGESNIITGILSPDSARSAQVSENWEPKTTTTEAETSEDADAEDTAESDDDSNDTSNEADSSDGENVVITTNEDSEEEVLTSTEDMTNEEIVALACEECSCLYISAGSYLTDQAETIASIATSAGVSTFGGDAKIGAYTLATYYVDSYDQGYRAGKVAFRILDGGEDPSEIKIGASDDEGVKLFNSTVAEALGMSFPKSFSEITEYLSTYVPGTNTTRVNQDEDDE